MEMNMQISTAPTADFRVLTDDELDDVNGGLIWFILGGLALAGLGAAAGWLAGNMIANVALRNR
jgi:lactobin A/cerein 7B family class IIb bacteriocin